MGTKIWDPEWTPEQGPEWTPEQGPERTPEQGPERTPEQGPEQTPEQGPEQGPERTPEQGPEQDPEWKMLTFRARFSTVNFRSVLDPEMAGKWQSVQRKKLIFSAF